MWDNNTSPNAETDATAKITSRENEEFWIYVHFAIEISSEWCEMSGQGPHSTDHSTIFFSKVNSDWYQRNHLSSEVLTFVLGIHRNSSVGFPAQKANYAERVSLTSSCFFGHSTTDINRFSILMIYTLRQKSWPIFSDTKINMMPSSNLYDFWWVHKMHASVHFLCKI